MTDFLTKCENLSLTKAVSLYVEKWDTSEKYPLVGKVAARVVGPVAIFIASVIDALIHALFTLLKTPVNLLLAPYNAIAIHFIPGKTLPRDLEIRSICMHLFRVIESVFFAASLPLITLFNPSKAHALSRFRETEPVKRDQHINKKEIEEKNKKTLLLEKELNNLREKLKNNLKKQQESEQLVEDLLNYRNNESRKSQEELYRIDANINRKNKKILELNNEINELLQNIEKNKEQIQKQHSQIEFLKNEIQNTQEKASDIRNQLGTLTRHFNDLKVEETGKNKEIQNKDHEIQRLQKQLENIKDEEKIANLNMQKLQHDIETLKGYCTSQQEEIKEKKEKLQHIENEIENVLQKQKTIDQAANQEIEKLPHIQRRRYNPSPNEYDAFDAISDDVDEEELYGHQEEPKIENFKEASNEISRVHEREKLHTQRRRDSINRKENVEYDAHKAIFGEEEVVVSKEENDKGASNSQPEVDFSETFRSNASNNKKSSLPEGKPLDPSRYNPLENLFKKNLPNEVSIDNKPLNVRDEEKPLKPQNLNSEFKERGATPEELQLYEEKKMHGLQEKYKCVQEEFLEVRGKFSEKRKVFNEQIKKIKETKPEKIKKHTQIHDKKFDIKQKKELLKDFNGDTKLINKLLKCYNGNVEEIYKLLNSCKGDGKLFLINKLVDRFNGNGEEINKLVGRFNGNVEDINKYLNSSEMSAKKDPSISFDYEFSDFGDEEVAIKDPASIVQEAEGIVASMLKTLWAEQLGVDPKNPGGPKVYRDYLLVYRGKNKKPDEHHVNVHFLEKSRQKLYRMLSSVVSFNIKWNEESTLPSPYLEVEKSLLEMITMVEIDRDLSLLGSNLNEGAAAIFNIYEDEPKMEDVKEKEVEQEMNIDPSFEERSYREKTDKFVSNTKDPFLEVLHVKEGEVLIEKKVNMNFLTTIGDDGANYRSFMPEMMQFVGLYTKICLKKQLIIDNPKGWENETNRAHFIEAQKNFIEMISFLENKKNNLLMIERFLPCFLEAEQIVKELTEDWKQLGNRTFVDVKKPKQFSFSLSKELCELNKMMRELNPNTLNAEQSRSVYMHWKTMNHTLKESWKFDGEKLEECIEFFTDLVIKNDEGKYNVERYPNLKNSIEDLNFIRLTMLKVISNPQDALSPETKQRRLDAQDALQLICQAYNDSNDDNGEKKVLEEIYYEAQKYTDMKYSAKQSSRRSFDQLLCTISNYFIVSKLLAELNTEGLNDEQLIHSALSTLIGALKQSNDKQKTDILENYFNTIEKMWNKKCSLQEIKQHLMDELYLDIPIELDGEDTILECIFKNSSYGYLEELYAFQGQWNYENSMLSKAGSF